MADQRHFEAGFGQFSKSGWIRTPTNNSTDVTREVNDWEIEGLTGNEGVRTELGDMADNEDDVAGYSDAFAASDYWALPPLQPYIFSTTSRPYSG